MAVVGFFNNFIYRYEHLGYESNYLLDAGSRDYEDSVMDSDPCFRLLRNISVSISFIKSSSNNAGVTSVTPSCMEKSKPLSNNLILPCPDVSGRCKWFHEVGDTSSPIPLAADNSGNLVLLSNEVYSYGKFIANTTTNISGCYEVCPADSSSKYQIFVM